MTAIVLGSLCNVLIVAFASPDAAPPDVAPPDAASPDGAPLVAARPEVAPADHVGRSAGQTVLRIARSIDGLTFIDPGRVFVVGASGPDLTRLPNGDLLALFDHALDGHEDGRTVMAVSRSKDQGRTWSPMRLARLRGPAGRRVVGRHGDLVESADSHYRLYFATTAARAATDRDAAPDAATTLLSAVTRNGLEYRVDAKVGLEGLPPAAGSDVHPMAVRLGDRTHLYAAVPAPDERAVEGSKRTIPHAVSADGRRFTEDRAARIPPVRFVGSLVPIGKGVRAYVSLDEGIGSLVSANGRDWRAEAGVRLARAWDPAVVRLEDGSFLMIYCAARDDPRTPAQQIDLASDAGRLDQHASVGQDDEGEVGDVPDGPAWEDETGPVDSHGQLVDGQQVDRGRADALVPPPSEEELAWLDEFDEDEPFGWVPQGDAVAEHDDWALAADAAWDGDIEADADWDDDLSAGADWDDDLDDDLDADVDRDDGFAGEWTDEGAAGDPLDLAPKPDLETHFNYVEWFGQRAFPEIADNAFDLYAEFMPFLFNDPTPKPDWPDLANMFSDPTYDGPPGPWEPARHPQWEASSQAAQEVLARFSEAGWAEGYALRPSFADDRMFDTPDDEPLLLEMLLPALGPHRDLAKATLADAWRAEDGQVSPQRMLDAWETTLRNADHISSGPTLIEGLVGMAERALVQKNAMWALQYDVFDEHGLEEALDLLTQYDYDDTDPVRWVRGEHAMAMQTVQYMFEPGQSDEHKVRVAETMSQLVDNGILDEEAVNAYATLDEDDARIAIDAFDDYYRELLEQWRTGYPEVRAADMDATTEEYVHTNALTETLLPSLSRVHQLRTRCETSRRATQLSYAAHLFKARNGRWPESLDELPDDYNQRTRVDPFTGDYFGYRLTEDGPTIYSASENGLDDGGIHSPRWGDQITNDAASDDHVFWPPQHPRS